MTRTPTHTFDSDMRCIRCRCSYASRPPKCDGPRGTAGNANLGALAKRNAFEERRRQALEGMVR